MSTEKHTPTERPWVCHGSNIYRDICSGDLVLICSPDQSGYFEKRQANAELIVTAVNNHDRLEAENKKLKDLFNACDFLMSNILKFPIVIDGDEHQMRMEHIREIVEEIRAYQESEVE